MKWVQIFVRRLSEEDCSVCSGVNLLKCQSNASYWIGTLNAGELPATPPFLHTAAGQSPAPIIKRRSLEFDGRSRSPYTTSEATGAFYFWPLVHAQIDYL